MIECNYLPEFCSGVCLGSKTVCGIELSKKVVISV